MNSTHEFTKNYTYKPLLQQIEISTQKNLDEEIKTGNKPIGDITLSWHNVNVYSSKKKSLLYSCSQKKDPAHILKNVNGVARSSQLLAIMGASGAGKTSLLNVLTMRTARRVLVNGKVEMRIGGKSISSKDFINMSAYVQQEDLFISTLTVKEQLIFQALLRIDRKITYKERVRKVNETISEFGLKHCADTVIARNISGGEIKRLGLAAGFLTNPSLMFCDEPTSGLDSFMAITVVKLLKSMATKGKLIVIAIHQPSSEVFALFDRILLMAEGRIAFLGSRNSAYDFFKMQGFPCPYNVNPAEFYIMTLAIVPDLEEERKKRIHAICDQFESSNVELLCKSNFKSSSNYYAKGDLWAVQQTRYKVSWWTQFRVLLWRSALTVLREQNLLKARLFQSTIVSLLIGIVFFGQISNQEGVINISGAVYMLVMSLTYINVFGVISVFCLEQPVIYREHEHGMYGVEAYFLARTMAEVPLFIIIALQFIVITYWMIGFHPGAMQFVTACAILTLMTQCAISFGYLISTCCGNITLALTSFGIITAPFNFLGGFFMNTKSIPSWLKWVRYLSWFSFANEALMINQWQEVNYIECSHPGNQFCFRNGSQVLESKSFSTENYTFDIIILVLQLLVYRIAACLAFLIRVKARN